MRKCIAFLLCLVTTLAATATTATAAAIPAGSSELSGNLTLEFQSCPIVAIGNSVCTVFQGVAAQFANQGLPINAFTCQTFNNCPNIPEFVLAFVAILPANLVQLVQQTVDNTPSQMWKYSLSQAANISQGANFAVKTSALQVTAGSAPAPATTAATAVANNVGGGTTAAVAPNPSPSPTPAGTQKKISGSMTLGFSTCAYAQAFASNASGVGGALASSLGVPANSVSLTPTVQGCSSPRRLAVGRMLTPTPEVILAYTIIAAAALINTAASSLTGNTAIATLDDALKQAWPALQQMGFSVKAAPPPTVTTVAGPSLQDADAAVGSQAASALFVALFVRWL